MRNRFSSCRLWSMPMTMAARCARVRLAPAGKPLETWLQYQVLIPSIDPYLVAVVALSRSALGGVGTVMMHLTRPQALTDLPTEAAAIARAARDVGVRVGFAVSMRDRNPLVYGPSEPILATLPEPSAAADRSPRVAKAAATA